MLVKISENIYAMVWTDYRRNNCNTYLITGRPNIIIDPGHRQLFHHVRESLAELGLTPADIGVVLVTHAHPDHFEAARSFGEDTLFGMGALEYSLVRQAGYLAVPEADFLLQPGVMTLGDSSFQVLLSPGHSPGSICFYEEKNGALFCGDVVFENGIGRTDLPGGSGRELKESIIMLARLGASSLLSGHGNVVTGKEAVAANFKSVQENWFGYL